MTDNTEDALAIAIRECAGSTHPMIRGMIADIESGAEPLVAIGLRAVKLEMAINSMLRGPDDSVRGSRVASKAEAIHKAEAALIGAATRAPWTFRSALALLHRQREMPEPHIRPLDQRLRDWDDHAKGS